MLRELEELPTEPEDDRDDEELLLLLPEELEDDETPLLPEELLLLLPYEGGACVCALPFLPLLFTVPLRPAELPDCG